MSEGSSTNCVPGWRALIICPHPTLSDVATQALSNAGVHNVVHYFEYPVTQNTQAVLGQNNICFIDATSNPTLALRLVLRFAGLNVPVVAILASDNEELTVQCFRKGAIEAIVLPTEAEKFQSMLYRVAARRAYDIEPPNHAGTLYSVLAGKGSAGSTTVAMHLALAMAEEYQKKVLLVDLDAVTGSIAFLLGLKPEFGLSDMLADLARIDEDLWARLIQHVGPLDVLLANGHSHLQRITPEEVGAVIEFWRCAYDLIILDLPGCHSELTLPFARVSDSVLLVTGSELPTIHSTLRILTYLGERGIAADAVKLILNSYSPSRWSEGSIEAALGRKIYGHVPNAADVLRKALLDGKRVPSASEFSRSIAALGAQLTGGAPVALEKPRKSPLKMIKQLLTLDRA